MSADDLAAYLRDQPEDFIIDWYVDGMDPDQPWDVTWVDVLFEDGLAWVINSGLLDEEQEENYEGALLWPPDLVGHMLFDPERPAQYVGCIVTPLGEPVNDESIEQIRQALAQVSDKSFWLGTPAWSAQEINRAIEDWCMREVGRPMQARWDAEHGPSPEHTQIVEMIEAMKSGLEPKYLLHPGENEGGTGVSIYASEQVMEILMQEMTEPDE